MTVFLGLILTTAHAVVACRRKHFVTKARGSTRGGVPVDAGPH